MNMIPYGRQNISEEDIQAVVDVLHSDFLTQGPVVSNFEKRVASYCGAQHSVAANSATSALHIACLALGVGKGDIVWTSPITFVASANCALYCGAAVDFVDIDPRSYNISVKWLSEKLEAAEKAGSLPKVLIPVHLCGQACDMSAIYDLSQRYGFRIIEDASHAIGGKYQGEPIGDCRYSDITIFSFHPVKIITTGEGGMALTNDETLARRMNRLCSHGITREPGEMTHPSDGPWYYQQIELGFNYRMTELQAALGISQMHRLDEFVTSRHIVASKYDECLANIPVTVPQRNSDCYSSLHLYVIRLKLSEINKTHREVFELLRAANIGVNLHYIPVYRQPYYINFGYETASFPEAESYYSEAITMPLYPGLTEEQQDLVVAALREAVDS